MRSFSRPSSFACCVVVLAGLGFALAAQSPAIGDDAQAGTDLWRRTAHGWERIDQMRAELEHYRTPDDFFLTGGLTRPATARWDFHPAWLVAVQSLAVALAFRRWTRQV